MHCVDCHFVQDAHGNSKLYQEVLKIVGDVDIDEVPHHEFKEQSLNVKGIIRTAEFTPYANVRILCGCAF